VEYAAWHKRLVLWHFYVTREGESALYLSKAL
jgi:hypothetical protein